MSDKECTPGPWEADEFDEARVNCASRGEIICILGTEKGQSEVQANRALIVAAPDMAEALDAVVAINTRSISPAELFAVWTKARLAIAKARGEQ